MCCVFVSRVSFLTDDSDASKHVDPKAQATPQYKENGRFAKNSIKYRCPSAPKQKMEPQWIEEMLENELRGTEPTTLPVPSVEFGPTHFKTAHFETFTEVEPHNELTDNSFHLLPSENVKEIEIFSIPLAYRMPFNSLEILEKCRLVLDVIKSHSESDFIMGAVLLTRM
jgi:hypothetical protein